MAEARAGLPSGGPTGTSFVAAENAFGPPGLGPPGAWLVGLDRELHLLSRRIGVKGINIVLGDAGSGKTALVRTAAAIAGTTLFEAVALYPLRAVPGLPLRRATRDDLPADADAASDIVVAALAGRTLWLDDAQWADPFTLAVATAVARRAPVTVTVRTSARGNDVLAALGEACLLLELAPLGATNAAALARHVNPTLSAEQAAAVAEHAGNNPLIVIHLAAASDPAIGLRRSVAGRMAELGVDARTALAALGLLGRRAPRRLLGDGVDELIAAGLATDAGQGVVAWRHQLVAEIAASLLTDEARRSLHARLARLLEDPAERARHHAGAGEVAAAMAASLVAAARAATAAEKVAHLSFAAEHAPAPMAGRLWVRAAAHATGEQARRLTAMAAPRRPLSPRETEVMALVAEGCTSSVVAVRLGLSPQTVESHVRAAVTKTGARNRTEAAVLAAQCRR